MLDLGTNNESSPRHALHDSLFNNAANRDDSLYLNPERKQIIPRRRLHEQKRQRIEDQDDAQNEFGKGGIADGEGERGVARPKIDLSPCHVCWRKPTDKSQLDSYAYCEGCGDRTCFICMRVCEGVEALQHTSMGIGDGAFSFEFDGPVERDGDASHDGAVGEGGMRDGGKKAWQKDKIVGHRGRICSRCCVEKGVEGDVWCLGCLSLKKQ
jgi:hypothetical protein